MSRPHGASELLPPNNVSEDVQVEMYSGKETGNDANDGFHVHRAVLANWRCGLRLELAAWVGLVGARFKGPDSDGDLESPLRRRDDKPRAV